jgi:hypothetical protein
VSVDHRRAGLRALRLTTAANPIPDVSVDHRRAGLRAKQNQFELAERRSCQSITGALACAPHVVIATDFCGTCQSITGALACAPLVQIWTSPDQIVSVDHRRAGLRAWSG